MPTPHDIMSFCIISCHIVSCIRHVLQYSSNVKDLLISSFMEWCDAFFLGQTCMNSCANEGVKKVWTSLGGSTFYKPFMRGGGQRLFRRLTKLLANGPIIKKCAWTHADGGRIKWPPLWLSKMFEWLLGV